MRRRRRQRKKGKFKIIFILVLVTSFLVFMNCKIMGTIYRKCNFEISRFANNEINNAVTQVINEYGYDYDH